MLGLRQTSEDERTHETERKNQLDSEIQSRYDSTPTCVVLEGTRAYVVGEAVRDVTTLPGHQVEVERHPEEEP